MSSLRHDADLGVNVAFQIDASNDLVPTLETVLADVALEAVQRSRGAPF